MTRALEHQSALTRQEKRIDRLKAAVKRLNTSRRMVSKKVDLLCNDLVSAYGELSRQLDEVRVKEAFRKLLAEAKDLEQLLCHTMDWLLRQIGYSNVAIWLASEEQAFELGAYMKYTIAGEPELTDAMRDGLLQLATREGVLRYGPDEIAEKLSKQEALRLKGQNLLAVNCTYLGEPLAVFVCFRDAKCPFVDEDVEMLKAITPIFAAALASTVRRGEEPEGDTDNPFYDDSSDGRPRRDDRDDRDSRNAADWWKRGEPPPF